MKLAARLGLGETLSEGRAISVLSAHGIVPETGWNREGPATDLLLVQIQKAIHLTLADVARSLGVAVPPTLGLVISTPGQTGGQTFNAPGDRAVSVNKSRASATPSPNEARRAERVVIETPHPLPVGDDQLPVVWSYRLRVPSAAALRLHLARVELAPSDFVQLLDRYGHERWKMTASRSPATNIWTDLIEGDTAVILVHAGDAQQGWGISVDEYGYADGR